VKSEELEIDESQTPSVFLEAGKQSILKPNSHSEETAA